MEARIGPGQMGLYIILHLVNNRTLSNNRLRKVKNLRQNHQKIFSKIKFIYNDLKNSSKGQIKKIWTNSIISNDRTTTITTWQKKAG